MPQSRQSNGNFSQFSKLIKIGFSSQRTSNVRQKKSKIFLWAKRKLCESVENSFDSILKFRSIFLWFTSFVYTLLAKQKQQLTMNCIVQNQRAKKFKTKYWIKTKNWFFLNQIWFESVSIVRKNVFILLCCYVPTVRAHSTYTY